MSEARRAVALYAGVSMSAVCDTAGASVVALASPGGGAMSPRSAEWKPRPVGPGTRVPKWWYRVAALKAEGATTAGIVADVGKPVRTVQHALASLWMRETLARIDFEARERLIAAAVDPRVQAQLEAPAAMGRLIAASREAEKPLEVAAINKDVLNYAGYAPAEKKLIMSVEAQIADLPLEVLEEWKRTQQLPPAVQAILTGPQSSSDS